MSRITTRITRADHCQFTNGCCHQLAYAIHQITGWPVCAFWTDGEYDVHAFVRTPWRTYLDVEGEHTRYKICSHWDEWHIHMVRDLEEMKATWDEECPFPDGDARAKVIAPLVIGMCQHDI